MQTLERVRCEAGKLICPKCGGVDFRLAVDMTFLHRIYEITAGGRLIYSGDGEAIAAGIRGQAKPNGRLRCSDCGKLWALPAGVRAVQSEGDCLSPEERAAAGLPK